jgi:iron complex outermembrane receptor protein
VVTATNRAQQTTVAPNSHVESKAAFAQGTYHLTDTFSVTAGVRYTSDQKEVDQNFQRTSLAPSNLGESLPGFPILIGTDRTFNAWTPKLGIAWQTSDDLYLFASVIRGFKSGGTNFAGTDALTLSFDPEYIWSYEAGVKSDWLDRHLRINLTGFYYDYTDLQVQSLIRPGVASIGNAAKARAKGLEIETIAQPTENLSLSLNFSLLDNVYSSFVNSSVPSALVPFVTGDPRFNAATGTYDATGNRLGGAPRSSASANVQYDIPTSRGKFYGRAEYYWQDRVFYQPTNRFLNSQAPYDLTNLSVGYLDDDQWSVRIIAKNVGDTQYLISYGPTAGGPAGPPRTIAVQFTKQW